MSMISELVDRLRTESKSMGKYGTDYMATLLMQASDTIIMLSEKARADRPQGKWLLKDNVFHCGCCGKESHFTADDVYVYDMPLPDFCEKCGAMMKGADDE